MSTPIPIFERRCLVIVETKQPASAVPNLQVTTQIKMSGLRTQFRVEKQLLKLPNASEIQITNLNENTRAKLNVRNVKVALFAGWGDNQLSLVYSGNVRTIDHIRSGPDWITKIQCGDGEFAFRFARMSESFRAGVNVKDVAKKAIDSLVKNGGLDPGNAYNMIDAQLQGQYVSGYAASGQAFKELDGILAGRGLEVSIQDGRLQVLKTGGNTGRHFRIDPNAIVGSPQHGTPDKHGLPSTVKIKTLLEPQILPGMIVDLDSLRKSGLHGSQTVQLVKHEGDTASGAWYTEIEARNL